MNNNAKSRWMSAAGALLLVGVGAVVGWWVYVTGPETVPAEETRAVRAVRTQAVTPGTHDITLTAFGTVVPSREVTIESQVTGEIIALHPALIPGGYIGKGEELFSIDPTLMELSLRETEASLERMDAMVGEALRKLEEARELAGEQVISETELLAREAELRIQRAEMERIQASRERTRELLRRHRVTAPFNALVLEESVDVGQRVDPGFAAARLIGADEFWVRASLPMDQLRWIRLPSGEMPGARARVFLETGGEHPARRDGRVVQLLSDAERTGRMARVLVGIDDPMGRAMEGNTTPFLAGSYVRIEIDAGTLENVLAIDRRALRDGNRIWVVEPGNTLQIRDVTVLWQEQETVYINNAMKPGETLVVSSLRVALPGMKVRPNPMDSPAPETAAAEIRP